MRDALGTYFNLTLLFFFILLITSLVALSVNYTKAYRVKNNVLTLVEKYEGNMNNEDLLDRTQMYTKSIGYTIPDDAIAAAEREGYTCPYLKGQQLGWCYIKNPVEREKFTVNIVVFININIPIVNRIFSNFKFFWMTGKTNSIPVL